MKRWTLSLAAAGLLAGCVPTDLTRPLFPPVPPEKPAAEKAEAKIKSDDREQPPVTAANVTEATARQSARDLDAELDRDAPTAKRE